ncbi:MULTISPECIES: hypothetical protein [unclassified Arcicella]|uniref:hypothetical protein n=1 Tax=unclassified Arcicella TaxID=2644986 RepID=UPI002866D655|nr:MULTISPECIES: hypothetical protein [unclassified Arcicella]MDR6564003.1 hypothetical protein [Arcicella sp. BE51]MDR6813756.1 hypothetical protein [Arcicella sp. BE140]MDR6825068.1 hypothetical protein [Arcicella sp. BE139]
MKRVLIFLFTLLGGCQIFAQENSVNLSQNPASLKWSQIKTPHFRLIFPTNIQSIGQRTANVLETVYQPVSNSLGHNPRPISILLQNQTTVSNGFVSLFPRRSEFYTTPPQDYTLLGTNNWLDLLAVHEFRHVVQYDKALTGITKLVYTIFGNNGLGIINSLAVPNWFAEGDAVGTESALTTSGRGKIPAFDMALRTQLLTKGAYSYSKAVGGSYKNFIPNHYVNGYLMTSYMKTKYGADAWDKILEGTYRMPFYPFSFSSNIKKVTGLTAEQLYSNAFEDAKKRWQTQLKDIEETPVASLQTNKNKFFTNYEFPQILPDGRILALKSGLSDIQQFVMLDKQNTEEKVIELGIFNNAGMLSVAGTKVAWAEFNFDVRWGQRDYSVIKVYDFNTETTKTITHKTKFAAPALSNDASKIVVVETTAENNYNLVVLATESGKEIARIPNPNNAFYIHPRWTPDNEILAVKLLNGKKNIVSINADSYAEKELFSPITENIAHPVKSGNYVLFNSGVTGIDNIFAFDITTNKRYQVTNRKFGAFNPAVSADGKLLYFNDFTENGHRVVEMPFSPNQFLAFDETLNKPVKLFGALLRQEAGENLLKSVGNQTFDTKPYSKANIFNIYSWGAVFSSNNNKLNVGITSQDLLSTTAISTGYSYNANEKTGQFFADLSFEAWYPKINVNYTNGQRQTNIYIDKANPLDSLRSDKWNQQQIVVGVTLPFNFTRSKYYQSLEVGVNTAITQVSGYDLQDRYLSESFNGTLSSMIYTFAYSRQLKRAVRDIAPRWGQSISFYTRNLPFGGSLQGGLTVVQGSMYLPGFFPHHSLRLRAAFQHQAGFKNAIGAPNSNLYLFASPTFFPRGYGYRAFEDLTTGSVEYRLPLFDPDWNLGRLVYLKRLKANLFMDLGQGETNYNWTETKNGRTVTYKGSDTGNFTSIGFDFTAQFHLLRFSQQFEAGCRGIYLPNKGQFIFQPLVIDIGF